MDKSQVIIVFPNDETTTFEFDGDRNLSGALLNLGSITSKDKAFYEISKEAQDELIKYFVENAFSESEEQACVSIADYVLRQRKYILKISTQELARRAGVSVACINRLETGKTKNFDVNRLYSIARALEIDKEVLLYLAGVFSISSKEREESTDCYCNMNSPRERYDAIIRVKNDYKQELEKALKRSDFPTKYRKDLLLYAEFLYKKHNKDNA